MSEQHTKTPWRTAECRTEDFAILGKNDDVVVSCIDEYGHLGAVKEANARRIVASVNRLAAFTTEEIENGIDLVKTLAKAKVIEQQRDELLAAFNFLANDVNRFIEGSISSFQLNKTLELAIKARDSQC